MNSNSRGAILDAIRGVTLPGVELPDLRGFGIRYSDPVKQFGEAVQSVGGGFVRVADEAGLQAAIGELPVRRDATRIASLVPGAGAGNVDLAALTDPHEMEGIDLAILAGELAVAENGAVWVSGRHLPHRGVFVVTQHLVLVVAATDVVHNMHEAYERLELTAGAPGFGVFISGPSKTADIEQALVIGAHGARSCTVVMVGSGPRGS